MPTTVIKSSYKPRRFQKKVIYKKNKKRAYNRKALLRHPARFCDFGRGFPEKVKITHRWVENFNLTSTSGVLNYKQHSCNGMYLNVAGAHQPAYFDQMAVFWRYYQVIGSKITYKILPLDTNTKTVLIAAFVNDDTSFESSSYAYAQMEQDTGKSRFLPLLGGTSEPAKITLKWSSKRVFGNKGLATSTLQGTSTSNPSEQSYYSLLCQAFDGSSSVTISVLAEIEYIAIWTERYDIGPS